MNPDLARDFVWLLEQGIIFEPKSQIDPIVWDRALEIARKDPTYIEIGNIRAERAHDPQFVAKWFKSLGIDRDDKDLLETFGLMLDVALGTQQLTRPVSVALRESLSADSFPLLTTFPHQDPHNAVRKEEIVSVVISKMPTPSESVSWEQIIEYRNDPDTKGKFLALRHWMSEVARADLPLSEIEEKLEWLLYQYKRHLELHKMKTSTTTFETLVVASAECVENLLKLNIAKVAKGLFAFRHRQLALLEGELSSPGNEVAYIVKAEETFSK